MSTTKTDPGTPIFGELNQELELPNIEVQDFEPFGFDFSTDSASERDESDDAADAVVADATSDDSTAQSSEVTSTESAVRGRRRRRES